MWIFEWPLGWFNSGTIIFEKLGTIKRTHSRIPVAKSSALMTAKTDSRRPVAKTTMNRI